MVYLLDPYYFRKMSMKKCIKCKKEKDRSEFYNHSSTSDGLDSRCKHCMRSDKRKKRKDPAYRKHEKEKQKEYEKTERAKKKRTIRRIRHVKTDWEKLRNKLKQRLYAFVIGTQDSQSKRKLFGCTRDEFRAHLESQFADWMTWDKYGKQTGKPNEHWNFDHILPYYAFSTVQDLEDYKHVVCWHKNVRPLCANQNCIDGYSFNEEDKQALIGRYCREYFQ